MVKNNKKKLTNYRLTEIDWKALEDQWADETEEIRKRFHR